MRREPPRVRQPAAQAFQRAFQADVLVRDGVDQYWARAP